MNAQQAPPTEAQLQRQRQLDLQLLKIHKRAGRAWYWKERREEAKSQLDQLEEAHPEIVRIAVRENTGWLFLLLGLVAIYFLDYFLFRPTIEYIIRHFFGFNAPNMIATVQLLVPAIILVLELNIASLLYLNRPEVSASSSTAAYLGWFVVGAFTALVMPSLVVATFLASQPSWTSVFSLQIIGLTTLSATAHIVVLFGGRPAHEGKAYLTFWVRRKWLRFKTLGFSKKYRREVGATVEYFIKYVRGIKDYNATYPNFKMEMGPFDTKTRVLTIEEFGYEIIEYPTQYRIVAEDTTQKQKRAAGSGSSASDGRSEAGVQPPELPRKWMEREKVEDGKGDAQTASQEAENETGKGIHLDEELKKQILKNIKGSKYEDEIKRDLNL